MRKLLLLGFILAILMLAFPQGVMAATEDQATVSATVKTVTDIDVELTTPTAWVLNRLDADENDKNDAINVTVDCNGDWTVTPTDVNTASETQGYMLDSTGSIKLTDPFQLEKGEGSESFDTLDDGAFGVMEHN